MATDQNWTTFAQSVSHVLMRAIVSILCFVLVACEAPPPQLADRISAEALAEDVPQLIPLAPFTDVDALLPEDRGQLGLALAARAASLRRRAAALQALPLN